MKHLAHLAFASLCLTFLSVASLADETMRQQLIGHWSGSATNPRGDVATTTFELQADSSFIGLVSMNQKPFMAYSGKWHLEGNQLVWNYLKSSIPLPEAAKVDKDEIVSVDAEKLVVISKLSGQKRVFSRDN